MHHRLTISIANLWIYISHFRVVVVHVCNTGEIPNPAFPKTVNDKFLWRKIFDHDPYFVPLSDKIESQNIAKQKCADVLIPRVLWIGKRACDIPDELLHGNVLVKASHGSGFFHPIFNGKFDRQEVEAKADNWMQRTYGRHHWEWGYFGLEPNLYVEEMILDETGGYGTTEAKLYIYCGRIEQIVMIYDRQLEPSATVFHGDWSESTEGNKVGLKATHRPPPENRQQIEQVALQLSHGLDHVRCDLYLVGNRIWFGEYTIYNLGGYLKLKSDRKLMAAQRNAWDIRQSWFLRQQHNGLCGWYVSSLLALLQQK